ncbi:2-hydroxycarboxylate transporter family protein [Oleisolibacter albus]|uniref:2-hydroxycarboxylate transporter family protein n=1 Tax=Oleisolibacter albus TaxID=2171757 RepID=UPI000DF2CAE8|nr:2-hydroxycarboxylate transporter family protein [Oleisolibacter albus]
MTSVEAAAGIAAQKTAEKERFWPYGWWKIMDFRIGIIPLPAFLILSGIIYYHVCAGKVPGEITMIIALLAVFGFTCAEIGKRTPVLKNIGAAAIFATFIPSALTYYHIIPVEVVKVTTDFTKQSQFLYLFIACIIVGSIFGMDRQVLIKGFFKIFVPLAVGSVAAAIVGTLVGMLVGKTAYETFFFLVVPIMAGGVGEGAIPLSIGYSEILGLPQGEMFATVLPPVMLGSLTAILLSGTLNYIGKRYPHLTGEGRLQPGVENEISSAAAAPTTGPIDPATVAAGGLIAICLYLMGTLSHKLFGLPAPVAMLFIAVLFKLSNAISPRLQEGGTVVYKFFQTAVTYPLLFAVGVSMTPWDKLMAAFTLPNLVTIFATVATLMGTGFLVGRRIGMYPIEAAIVNACHSGQGGTGDVAILTAANRMVLMPFAQIATRIGGALTVTCTLIVLAKFIA